jgi:hypothetical protein
VLARPPEERAYEPIQRIRTYLAATFGIR